MAKPGMTPVSGRKPTTRKISAKSATHHLAGSEAPYPVYQFSGRVFLERPNHNPFGDIVVPPPVGGLEGSWGSSWGTSWGSSWG